MLMVGLRILNGRLGWFFIFATFAFEMYERQMKGLALSNGGGVLFEWYKRSHVTVQAQINSNWVISFHVSVECH